MSADAYVDEDKFETHDEHEHIRPLEKVETFDERHSPSSPPISSVKMCQDNATDVPGKSSPVSVLEPFFTDDDTSPNSSRLSSGIALPHQLSILIKILFRANLFH